MPWEEQHRDGPLLLVVGEVSDVVDCGLVPGVLSEVVHEGGTVSGDVEAVCKEHPSLCAILHKYTAILHSSPPTA